MKAAPRKPSPGSIPPVPDISTPIMLDQTGSNTPPTGPLDLLRGNWNSQPAAKSDLKGYNVMPLPQANARNHFILKDFGYYEEMTIGGIDGNAPNRGGTYQQNCAVLFYDQRVFIGEGQGQNTLIHAENGSWLYLTTTQQDQGAFGTTPIPHPPAPDPVPPQDPTLNIVKQVSVPHGNSILATGKYVEINGAPNIPDVSTLPRGTGVDATFYAPFGSSGPNDPGNHTNLMVNPNYLLQQALVGQNIAHTIAFTVSTDNPGGALTNIIFEQKKANVLNFSTTFWLEKLEGEDTYNQLQYSQTIELRFMQDDVTFIHIDANTLRRIS